MMAPWLGVTLPCDVSVAGCRRKSENLETFQLRLEPRACIGPLLADMVDGCAQSLRNLLVAEAGKVMQFNDLRRLCILFGQACKCFVESQETFVFACRGKVTRRHSLELAAVLDPRPTTC